MAAVQLLIKYDLLLSEKAKIRLFDLRRAGRAAAIRMGGNSGKGIGIRSRIFFITQPDKTTYG